MQLETKIFVSMRLKRFGFLCFGAYLAVLLHLTLFTHNYYTYGRSANFDLFRSIRLMLNSGSYQLMLDNIVGNVFLFFPFGFLLPLFFTKLRNGFLLFAVSSVTSLAIEVSQYLFANRIFDIDDIFLNVVGAMTGWLFIAVLIKIMK